MSSSLLGLLAGVSALAYAFVRFAAALYVQRLKEKLLQAHHDWQQSRRHLEILEGKLLVAHSRKAEEQQRLLAAHRQRDKLYARLRLELPSARHAELEKCLAAPDKAAPEEGAVLHQLGLDDRIARVLSELTFLIVESRAADPAEDLLPELAKSLEAAGCRFYGPEKNLLICAFEQPEAGFEQFRAFIHGAAPEKAARLRAALYTGCRPAGQEGDFSGVFSHLLQQARQLLSRAPAGALLLDEPAYRNLEQQHNATLFDQVEQLHVFAWSPAGAGAAPGP